MVAFVIVNNSATTTVNLGLWKLDVPLIVVILVSMLLGVLFTLPSFMKIISNNGKLLNEKQKRINDLEKIVLNNDIKSTTPKKN